MQKRKNIRLKHFDYSNPGYYFVTICINKWRGLFGKIQGREMVLNDSGQMIENIWQILLNRFPVEVDTFQVMPNHIHLIVRIVGSGFIPDQSNRVPIKDTPTLSEIVGA